MNRKLLCLPISVLLFHVAAGQPKTDSAFAISAVNAAIKTYRQGLGAHAHLNNGVEHKRYIDEIERETYLEPDWTDGAIFYDQELYENTPLMHDLIAQRVVTLYFFGQAIDLITDRVDWFMINGRKFIYLGRSENEAALDAGFYELLENGSVKLYARRKKRVSEKLGETRIMHTVSDMKTDFFLCKDAKYFSVNSENALVAALHDKKEDLKQFKRKNKLRFGKGNKEIAMKQFVALYNELH